MIATLRLEHIGYQSNPLLKQLSMKKQPWVAEITTHYGRIHRNFLQPAHKDYNEANSKGTRGLHHVYHLRPGIVYEVNEHVSWRRSRRYYCHAVEGQIQELPTEVVKSVIGNAL